MPEQSNVLVKLLPVGALLLAVSGSPAFAAQPDDQASAQPEGLPDLPLLRRPSPDDGRMQRDAAVAAMKKGGVSAKAGGKVKNLKVVGRGERLASEATTDVWALGKFAYTGTFNNPCGGEEGGGVHVWDVGKEKAKKKSTLKTVIDSPVGSRSNDVKVATMNSGDILVHSNESCGGGPGGFEIYNVDKPKNPVWLASVTIDELNPISDFLFGGIVDVGVHNLWLFTQGDKDYVAAVAETVFDNFMIFDITDPSNPTLVSAWGAEEIFDPGVGDATDVNDPTDFDRVLAAALWLLDGFGASTNRFLHDITISADGQSAYLSNWDAGLVLLDIWDPTDPQLVSVALDPANGSLDGEVNSHAAWPNEDGTVVVETEEDFSAWEASTPPGNLTMDSAFPGDPTIPGTAISTVAGDDFEANQTGNVGTTDGTSVDVTSGPLAGNTYLAIELSTAAGSPTFGTTGPLSGELVWIGRGCATSLGDMSLNDGAVDPGDIVVVRRGGCFFEEKADTAASLGAAAVVIANNVTEATPWSGARIWDYSIPTAPVLASTYNTPCSASTAPSTECSELGTYSVHNVQVVGDLAYISWYSEGVLILDISDPYDPKEVARYNKTDDKFETENGGPQDVWGIYVDTERKKDNIFASDRNGGLYVLKRFKEKK